MNKTTPIEVTPEMIRAGVGVLLDFELGAMEAGEMVKRVFLTMLSLSSAELLPAPDPKDREGSANVP